MKRTCIFSSVAACTWLALGVSPAVAALTLGFSPVNQTVQLGGTASVDIVATLDGLANDPTNISGFDLTVVFDDSVVSVSSSGFAGVFGPSIQFNQMPDSTSIQLQEVSLGSNVPGPFSNLVLATIDFSADAVGVSPLTFRDVVITTDIPGAVAITVSPVELTTGSIRVIDRPPNGVPEGGDLAIVFLPTLLGLLVLGRRLRG